ncbi:MAG: hypothetical protein JXA94_05610 [Parachlamydiales bacterium]|nr:hypothetical protein [Parachlamydiales bacterium]
MNKNHYLTNERLKNKFKSFFDLVNYGIDVAKQMMAREEKVNLKIMIDLLTELPDQEPIIKA